MTWLLPSKGVLNAPFLVTICCNRRRIQPIPRDPKYSQYRRYVHVSMYRLSCAQRGRKIVRRLAYSEEQFFYVILLLQLFLQGCGEHLRIPHFTTYSKPYALSNISYAVASHIRKAFRTPVLPLSLRWPFAANKYALGKSTDSPFTLSREPLQICYKSPTLILWYVVRYLKL